MHVWRLSVCCVHRA